MTTAAEIKTLEVQHLLLPAQARAKAVGELQGSMRGMQANQVGALGELVGIEYLLRRGVEVEEIFSTAYDVAFISNGKRYTMEFKTKERTVAPLPSYDVTVPAYSHDHQRPDYYLFISLESTGKSDDITRFKRAHLLGTISRDEFDQVAKHWKPGDVDETNNWQPTIECYNVQVADLRPL